MSLAVAPDQAVWPDEDGCVVEDIAFTLEQPADHVRTQTAARGLECLRRRSRDVLRERHRLLEAVEHIPGYRALGQHEELRSRSDRLFETRDPGLEIPVVLAQPRLRLSHGDVHLEASLIV